MEYKFLAVGDFKKIGSVEEMQLVYWSEMVQRIHICGTTSLKRVRKWLDAMQTAYQSQNYYGFCSTVRGLVEACSDTSYTFQRIVTPLCSSFSAIETALKGEATGVLLSQEVEDELLHYMCARKLSKSERAFVPGSHSAKHATTYLGAIKDQGVLDLYSELCQVSHPSQVSLLPFLVVKEDGTLAQHATNVDAELNRDLIGRHKQAIVTASHFAALPAVCLLKYVNEFRAPIVESLRTDEASLAQVQDNHLWENMRQRIDASRAAPGGIHYGKTPS